MEKAVIFSILEKRDRFENINNQQQQSHENRTLNTS